MSSENLQTKWGQFISLIIVFFFWGFVFCSANDIPVFKRFYAITSSISTRSLGILCICRINYFLLGIIKVDVLQKFGYKRHYLLVYYFLHLVLFVPAATMEFSFLPYRFIYSRTWFSIQQIVANPLAIKMGSPILVHRLTLAGESTLWNYYWCYFTRNRIIRNGNDKKQTFL
jgi:FHS family L-fucose permease-like MFS transporter